MESMADTNSSRSKVSLPAAGETMSPLRIFFRDIKFEHSIFALPFAYLGLFLAERGWPRLSLLFWVSVAMVSFRTFAMTVNRLIDREIDARNPRTKMRALPQERLSSQFVGGIAVLSVVIFLGTAWLLGRLCLLLSPIPILLAVIYPTLKRFTWLSHGVLGIILGISPYGSWLASRGEFSWVPGLLLIGVACWVSGFDIFYSLQDVQFDRASGIRSIPVGFGEKGAVTIAGFLHLLAILSWSGVGLLTGLHWIYGLGLATVGIFLLREHWLVRQFGSAKINQAFFTMNAAISVVLFLAAFADLSLMR